MATSSLSNQDILGPGTESMDQNETMTMQLMEMEKEHKQQLKLQQDEYEANIQRHLTFIDQLIEDKKILTDRCDGFVTKLKEVKSKYSFNIKQITESHTDELKKQKSRINSAEKVRREKWIREKTQEIKEATVKDLEPEIQKLIAIHKAEFKKIKTMKQAELLETEERAGRKFHQEMEDLRSELEREKDAAVRAESEIVRKKYEGEMKEEQKSFQQQRLRLNQELDDVKEQCNQQIMKLKQECDNKLSDVDSLLKHSADTSHTSHLEQIDQMKREYQASLDRQREKMDTEKVEWQEKFMKKQETEILQMERKLKEGARDERDKEIEMVIQRLEREASESREEVDTTSDNRIRRLREKYEKELNEVEANEKAVQEKFMTMKQKHADMEVEYLRMKSEMKEKDQELTDMKKTTERLHEERDKVLVLETDNERLRNELCEERTLHKLDVDKMRQGKENEMEQLHQRVKKAIANKDENTKILKEKMMSAEKRAEHLEQLLADQGKKIPDE